VFKWHTDADRHGERILVISLTDSRAIGFRSRSDSSEPYVLSLDAGDGYLIRATARWQWEHRVMPVGQGRGGGESFVLAYRR
jgi:alkylated DNA repair dioxygenase AlkB